MDHATTHRAASYTRKPAAYSDHIAEELCRYERHLRDVRGLAEVIALWLGHESPVTTHHYVEADLTMKERALSMLHEPEAKTHRYTAPDSLIDFLKKL